MYVKELNSYFLIDRDGIFRKDINKRAPYPYITKVKRSFSMYKKIEYHPVLKGRLIVFGQNRLFIVNLRNKKIELVYENFRWDGFNDSSFSCRKGQNLTVLLYQGNMVRFSLVRRMATHSLKIQEDSRYVASIADSDDQKYICVSFSSGFEEKTELSVFEVSDGEITERVSLKTIFRIPTLLFFGKVKNSYIFIGFLKRSDGAGVAWLFDFNSKEGTLRWIPWGYVNLWNKYPITVKRYGSEFFVFGQFLKFSQLSILTE